MLTIKGLEKSYGKFKAVNGLDMHIDRGEIYGFIGPNGAGKSTTMKIVSGLLCPDSGEVYIDDIDAIKNNRKLKEKIGYMPDFFGAYDNLKVIEYMEFYASIYGIVGNDSKNLILDLLELVNLLDKKDAYVDVLSRGMKQRLCLARSLVHNPELLILDEPASGMDPRARFEMKGILKNLKDMDKTVLVSSHILSELSEICTSVGIIERGAMVYSGQIEELLNKMSNSNPIKIVVKDKKEEAIKLIKEFNYVNKVKYDGNEILIYFRGQDEEIITILNRLVNNNIPVLSFGQISDNLEDIFMKITEQSEE